MRQKQLTLGIRFILLLVFLGGYFSAPAGAQDNQEDPHANHMNMDSAEKQQDASNHSPMTDMDKSAPMEMSPADSESGHAAHMHESHGSAQPHMMESAETGKPMAADMPGTDSESGHAAHMHESHDSAQPHMMESTETGKPMAADVPDTASESGHAAHMHESHDSAQPHMMESAETGKPMSADMPDTDSESGHAAHMHEAADVSQLPEIDLTVRENLGELIPKEIKVINEKGASVSLAELMNKPTILAFVYYQCPMACSLIQSSLASALNDVPYNLGSQYQVFSISFDDEDTPKDAQKAKNDYFKILKQQPEDTAWRFFTMDGQNAKKLGKAIGFPFKKTGPRMFIHPNLITVLGNEGKVIRYLYGTNFLPFNIGMAISEAKKGTPGISVKKILSYCFEYDPEKSGYTFKLFRIFGLVTLSLIAVLMFFLLRKRPEK